MLTIDQKSVKTDRGKVKILMSKGRTRLFTILNTGICSSLHVGSCWTVRIYSSTLILSWRRWTLTELWRSSRRGSAGASGSPWPLSDLGAGTGAEEAGPSLPPPGPPRHTTPQTDPTGWPRRPLRMQQTRSSRRGSTPPRWQGRCAAWSLQQDARSEGETKRCENRCEKKKRCESAIEPKN